MQKKVLIIDDSALMRRVISDIINEDERLTVADTANSGQPALDFIDQGRRYDVILVDIHMPKMDGVQFLKELNKRQVQIPTIVASSAASRSTNETIEALELGAFDFVKKPSGPVKYGFTGFRTDLLVRIYVACNLGNYPGEVPRGLMDTAEPPHTAAPVQQPAPARPTAPVQPAQPAAQTGASGQKTQSKEASSRQPTRKPAEQSRPTKTASVDRTAKPTTPVTQPARPAVSAKTNQTVPADQPAAAPPVRRPTVMRAVRPGEKLAVIASSTGGPKALQSVIPMFPKNFPYPVIVVQHMPEGFTASLATRLNEMSQLPVKEAENGEVLRGGVVYIAKGGRQCELYQEKNGQYQILSTDKPARGGLKPCADILLESLMDTSFEKIVCGVLTGMGGDASKGIVRAKSCKNIKVIAQDEATCVVYGMPRAAKVAGVVDEMVPLESIAGTMIKTIGV